MKKIHVILIIALCIAITAIPAVSAKEEKNDHAGPSGSPAVDGTRGGDERPSPGGAAMNTTGARDMDKGEDGRAGGQGMLPGNETRKEGAENAGSLKRNISGEGNDDSRDKDHARAAVNATRTNTAVRAGWTKNPNQVRDAVHSLLTMDNRTGGIGPQVSEIARSFNNSAASADQLESRIENRDFLSKFLFGGDKDAATQLTALTAQNRAAIQKILDIMSSATLDADTRATLDQQLSVLQAEQDRLDALAAQAQQQHGLFG